MRDRNHSHHSSPFGAISASAHREGSNSDSHFSLWLHDGRLQTIGGQSIDVDMLAFQSVWVTLRKEGEFTTCDCISVAA